MATESLTMTADGAANFLQNFEGDHGFPTIVACAESYYPERPDCDQRDLHVVAALAGMAADAISSRHNAVVVALRPHAADDERDLEGALLDCRVALTMLVVCASAIAQSTLPREIDVTEAAEALVATAYAAQDAIRRAVGAVPGLGQLAA